MIKFFKKKFFFKFLSLPPLTLSLSVSAVSIVLVMRNVCIAICAGIIIVYYQVKPTRHLYVLLLQIGLVLFGVLTEIASMCNSLMITRDWLVVVCKQDQTQISSE